MPIANRSSNLTNRNNGHRTCMAKNDASVISRYFFLFIICALLVTASFAYQAGNNFELTASTGKSLSAPGSSQPVHAKHPSDVKALLPNSPGIMTVAASLLTIYLLTIPASLFRVPYPQRLRRTCLKPIRFAGTQEEPASALPCPVV